MRESRVSGELRDLVAIEPHELVYGKRDGDGEDEGTEMAEESVAAAAHRRLTWSRVGQARLKRSSSLPLTQKSRVDPPRIPPWKWIQIIAYRILAKNNNT